MEINVTPTQPPKPEYGDFTMLRFLFGIPRSTAYLLESEGMIKFKRVGTTRKATTGKVLVDFQSVREMIEKADLPVNPDKRNRGVELNVPSPSVP